jgi:hypothetical protein
MARGRPRKSGKRNGSGRLIAPQTRDYGTDAAQARRDIFGENGCDAIGRAYTIGALGTGHIATDRLRIARQIFAWYWPSVGMPGYRCALNQEPRGHSPEITPEQHQEDLVTERKMNAKLADARKCGHEAYRAFDQLVIDVNPDCGPDWLDLLYMEWAWVKGTRNPITVPSMALLGARKRMKLALQALDAAGGLCERDLTIAA